MIMIIMVSSDDAAAVEPAMPTAMPTARPTARPAPTGMAAAWVLLCYRLPREPSTPRIGVWRKLERLGVARLGDGLVALPADARTREQMDWLAEEVTEAGGTASVWLTTPGSAAQVRAIAETMRSARAAEYQAIIAQARTAAGATSTSTATATVTAAERARVARRLRSELRRVVRRDYFPPPERATAQAAVQALTINAAPGATATDAAAAIEERA
jgi:hypothetical protein